MIADSPGEPTAVQPELVMLACSFPERLHPVSQSILDYYLAGVLTTPEFLRYFSLPNSDYIPLARCLVDLLPA